MGKASPGEWRRGAISGESCWTREIVGEEEEREIKMMMMRSLIIEKRESHFFCLNDENQS